MVLLGGKGYQALLEEAKAVGGDTIMDYSFDLEQTSVFYLFIRELSGKRPEWQ